jgi:hypothetical protein
VGCILGIGIGCLVLDEDGVFMVDLRCKICFLSMAFGFMGPGNVNHNAKFVLL